MTGLKISHPLSKELSAGSSQKEPANSPVDPAPCRRSAPAQKARPEPVTMATQASSSSRQRENASVRSRRMSAFMALRPSGRLYVMVATWPSSRNVAASPTEDQSARFRGHRPELSGPHQLLAQL